MAVEWTPLEVREYHVALAERAIDASLRTGADVKITATTPFGKGLTVEIGARQVSAFGTAPWIPGPSSD